MPCKTKISGQLLRPQEIILQPSEEFIVPSEVEGISVWVITQTGKILPPKTVIRAEQKTVLRVVPAVAGG